MLDDFFLQQNFLRPQNVNISAKWRKQNNHTRNPACSQPTKPYVPLPTKYKEETQ